MPAFSLPLLSFQKDLKRFQYLYILFVIMNNARVIYQTDRGF